MESPTNNRTLIWILATILVIALIIIAFLLGRTPSSTEPVISISEPEQIIPTIATPVVATAPNTTVSTPVPATAPETKTYSNTQNGLSFNYPNSWTVVENPSKKSVSVTSDTSYNSGGGFVIPMRKITFTLTDKSFFNPPINTKYGSISYENSLKTLFSDICMKAEFLSGSTTIKGIRYSGSNMSDPAYSTVAVLMANGSIYIINEESESASGPEKDAALAMINSLQFLNGNTTAYPACSL